MRVASSSASFRIASSEAPRRDIASEEEGECLVKKRSKEKSARRCNTMEIDGHKQAGSTRLLGGGQEKVSACRYAQPLSDMNALRRISESPQIRSSSAQKGAHFLFSPH